MSGYFNFSDRVAEGVEFYAPLKITGSAFNRLFVEYAPSGSERPPLSLELYKPFDGEGFHWLGVRAIKGFEREVPSTRMALADDGGTDDFVASLTAYGEVIEAALHYRDACERTNQNVQNDLRESDAGNK